MTGSQSVQYDADDCDATILLGGLSIAGRSPHFHAYTITVVDHHSTRLSVRGIGCLCHHVGVGAFTDCRRIASLWA